MNKKWTVLETEVTPKLLRNWADRLDKAMKESTIGDEVPFIESKDYNNGTNIILRADQEAWHNRSRGQWS